MHHINQRKGMWRRAYPSGSSLGEREVRNELNYVQRIWKATSYLVARKKAWKELRSGRMGTGTKFSVCKKKLTRAKKKFIFVLRNCSRLSSTKKNVVPGCQNFLPKPGSSTSSTGKNKEKGDKGNNSFSFFSFFVAVGGLPARRCRDELSPELRYQSDSSCRKIGKILFLPVRARRVAPFSCGQSSMRVVRGMSPKMKWLMGVGHNRVYKEVVLFSIVLFYWYSLAQWQRKRTLSWCYLRCRKWASADPSYSKPVTVPVSSVTFSY